jgi:hypothetical protein
MWARFVRGGTILLILFAKKNGWGAVDKKVPVDDLPPAFDRVRAAMATFRVQETSAIAAARAYGIDIGLLKESILRTPLERVLRNDEILATLATMRSNR